MRTRSKVIGSDLKASIGQLDNWDKAQAEQACRRQVANARFPHGFPDRLLAIARYRAALEVERPRGSVLVESYYCYFCDSGNHSTEECNVSRALSDPFESASESF